MIDSWSPSPVCVHRGCGSTSGRYSRSRPPWPSTLTRVAPVAFTERSVKLLRSPITHGVFVMIAYTVSSAFFRVNQTLPSLVTTHGRTAVSDSP